MTENMCYEILEKVCFNEFEMFLKNVGDRTMKIKIFIMWFSSCISQIFKYHRWVMNASIGLKGVYCSIKFPLNTPYCGSSFFFTITVGKIQQKLDLKLILRCLQLARYVDILHDVGCCVLCSVLNSTTPGIIF